MTFNKDITLALTFFGVGVILTTRSYVLVSMIADRFLLSYVHKFPIEQAVFSLDRFNALVDMATNIIIGFGVIFLALAVYFGSRFVAKAGKSWQRMVGIVFVSLVAFELALTLLLPWIV